LRPINRSYKILKMPGDAPNRRLSLHKRLVCYPGVPCASTVSRTAGRDLPPHAAPARRPTGELTQMSAEGWVVVAFSWPAAVTVCDSARPLAISHQQTVGKSGGVNCRLTRIRPYAIGLNRTAAQTLATAAALDWSRRKNREWSEISGEVDVALVSGALGDGFLLRGSGRYSVR
jgi:hypothetical protein